MRPRCVELARVLKKTGSFYYHCDWHASHYVKVMLDQIFGENFFQAEIVWKRTTAHGDTRGYGHITDSIFFYTSDKEFTWNRQIRPYEQAYLDKFYRQIDEKTGKPFMADNLTGAGVRHGETGEIWRGIDVTAKGRHWIRPPSELDKWEEDGLIYWPPKGGTPRFKRFIDPQGGLPLDNIWTDIPAVSAHSKERLGYPTQKPLELLRRIITASSNPGDVVLDAFCGCGTAVVAAEHLGRKWIGVDISPTACRVMAGRLKKACKLHEGKDFFLRDLPRTEKQLRALPHFEFENWAVIAIGGIPNKAHVGDMGIDGRIFPVSAVPKPAGKETGELDFMDVWYPVQVKQKDKAGRPDIDSFEAVMMREDRQKGFFVSFAYTQDARREIGAFFKRSHKVIIPFTVQQILDEEISAQLA
jgi:DNA modification methylase